MVVNSDHTVQIGIDGFYAQQCKLSQSSPTDNYDIVLIDRGLPKFYPVDILPRKMSFQVTDNKSRVDFLKTITAMDGTIQKFTSPMLGSFNAYIKITNYDLPDGQPEVSIVQMEITEVG